MNAKVLIWNGTIEQMQAPPGVTLEVVEYDELNADAESNPRLCTCESYENPHSHHEVTGEGVTDFEYFRNNLLERFPGFRDDSDISGGDLVEWLSEYIEDPELKEGA